MESGDVSCVSTGAGVQSRQSHAVSIQLHERAELFCAYRGPGIPVFHTGRADSHRPRLSTESPEVCHADTSFRAEADGLSTGPAAVSGTAAAGAQDLLESRCPVRLGSK